MNSIENLVPGNLGMLKSYNTKYSSTICCVHHAYCIGLPCSIYTCMVEHPTSWSFICSLGSHLLGHERRTSGHTLERWAWGEGSLLFILLLYAYYVGFLLPTYTYSMFGKVPRSIWIHAISTVNVKVMCSLGMRRYLHTSTEVYVHSEGKCDCTGTT